MKLDLIIVDLSTVALKLELQRIRLPAVYDPNAERGVSVVHW